MRRVLRGVVARAAMAGCASRSFTDARTERTPHPYDQIINSDNQEFVENMMQQYAADHSLVESSWSTVIEAIDKNDADMPIISAFSRPTSVDSMTEKDRVDNMRLSWMILQYETLGHLLARIYPLQNRYVENSTMGSEALNISNFGFSKDDMDRVFNFTPGPRIATTLDSTSKSMTLRQIEEYLRTLYCGDIGFEFRHSPLSNVRNWFRAEVIKLLHPLSTEKKSAIYQVLVRTCGLEKFVSNTYPYLSTAGLSGAEVFIPTLRFAMEEASQLGVKSVTIGMPRRGRLNLMVNVCQESLLKVFNNIQDRVPSSPAAGVLSPSGTSTGSEAAQYSGCRHKVPMNSGERVDVDVLPCASHGEATNLVALGKIRARQFYAGDTEGIQHMPILVHDDESFIGQGGCFEAAGLQNLKNFRVGGALHIVLSNHSATSSSNARKTPAGVYCTALSEVTGAPVMHVNGNKVEACVRAAELAVQFRQTFRCDVIINLMCYTRHCDHAHDTRDIVEPTVYQSMHKQSPLLDIYTEDLVRENVMTHEAAQSQQQNWHNTVQQSHVRAQSSEDFVQIRPVFDPESENTAADFEQNKLQSILRVAPRPPAIDSGVSMQTLRVFGTHITAIPAEVAKAHPVVERTYAARRKGIDSGDAIEWCLAELLAFATLSQEGVPVRLIGEDVERGTFTQRHAAVTDMQTNLKYFPVSTISKTQAPIIISNSSLSELGVSAFEFGYNIENTRSVVMWEAQFGDFANGAQVVFDQFLSCSEQKWRMPSSLILSLPHGYSGAGPEHSSARVERFLQLSDDVDHVPSNFRTGHPDEMLEYRIRKYNMQMVYPSTPASYFHLLRRQGVRDFAKPMVLFFSKARLRAPNLSRLDEMARGTRLRPVIDNYDPAAAPPRKLLFCSGQIESIVRDAMHRRPHEQQKNGGHDTTTDAPADNIALVTLEQLSPFPWEQVADVLERHTAANPDVQIIWLQEEPKNMGMWSYMRPRFNSLLRYLNLKQRQMDYIGRVAAASPSTGYGSVHVEEENAIIDECLL